MLRRRRLSWPSLLYNMTVHNPRPVPFWPTWWGAHPGCPEASDAASLQRVYGCGDCLGACARCKHAVHHVGSSQLQHLHHRRISLRRGPVLRQPLPRALQPLKQRLQRRQVGQLHAVLPRQQHPAALGGLVQEHLARAYAQQVAHALRLAAEQPGAIIAPRLSLQERVDAGHDAAARGAILLLVEAEHQGWRCVLPPALELTAAQARVELCYIHRQVQVAALDLLVQVQQLQLQLAAVPRLVLLRQLLVVLLVQLLLLLLVIGLLIA